MSKSTVDSRLLVIVCLKSTTECFYKGTLRTFREVGFVFDVFVPKNKANGKSKGFGFLRFKTEQMLERQLIDYMDVMLVVN